MDFEFNEDQKIFKESIRDFLDREITSLVDDYEKKGPMTKEEAIDVFKKFSKIGFTYDLESLREFVTDPVNVGIMMEELSHIWPSAVAIVGLSFPVALVSFAGEEIRERLLPKVRRNELIGCYAITEPEAGSDNRSMQTTAVLKGDEYIVNGSKTWISNGPIADLCLLVCNDEKNERLFLLIDKEISPYETNDLHKLGWRADPTGELYFDDCHVPRENNVMEMIGSFVSDPERLAEILGEEYTNFDLSGYMEILGRMSIENIIFSFLRSGMALMSTGISQAALDASIKYVRERVQFGRPIGRFQLIQEMLYNMTALTEASRLIGYKSLILASKMDPKSRLFSSLAKGFACDAATKVTYDAVQIHGGNGLSEDFPLERYFRDARMLTIPDGTAEIQKLIVGRELLGKGFSAYV